MSIKRQNTIQFSSDPSNGAENVNTTGNSFTVNFGSDGIAIPQKAQNVQVSVVSSEIWNVFPNLSQTSSFDVTYNDPQGAIITQTITFPAGIYSITTFQNKFENLMINAGFPRNAIIFSPEESTQRVEIIFEQPYYEITFVSPLSDGILSLIGFTQGTYGNFPIGQTPEHIVGTLAPRFNSINQLEIHSNIVNYGIRKNNKYSGIIATIPLNADVGSQIQYAPFNPSKLSADHLKGTMINSLNFRLTNENDQNIDTMGEYWAVKLKIEYDEIL